MDSIPMEMEKLFNLQLISVFSMRSWYFALRPVRNLCRFGTKSRIIGMDQDSLINAAVAIAFSCMRCCSFVDTNREEVRFSMGGRIVVFSSF